MESQIDSELLPKRKPFSKSAVGSPPNKDQPNIISVMQDQSKIFKPSFITPRTPPNFRLSFNKSQ